MRRRGGCGCAEVFEVEELGPLLGEDPRGLGLGGLDVLGH
jgi:hypothetical protein